MSTVWLLLVIGILCTHIDCQQSGYENDTHSDNGTAVLHDVKTLTLNSRDEAELTNAPSIVQDSEPFSAENSTFGGSEEQSGTTKIELLLRNLNETMTSLLKFQQQLHPTIDSSAESPFFENHMTRLHRFLHSKNRKLMGIRPRRNPELPTIVMLDVDLYQIIEMNEPEEYIKVNIHVNMTFYNEYLGWKPSDFGGVTSTKLDGLDEMWIPDIFAYNGVDMKNENFYFRPLPRITTNFIGENSSQLDTLATVEYSYPRVVKFSCSFETYYFPFDYQLCVLVFRSWSHAKREIYILPGDHMKNYTKENDEWNVVKIIQYSKLIKGSSSEEVFSVQKVEIILKRRPLYYIANLLIPSVIITQVAFFGFFCPSSNDGDRKEKVNLGMGTLLAMSVLLLTVCGMTPVSSDHIPLTGTFFLFNMVLISIGILMTSLIITVQQRGKRKKRVPKIVQDVLFFRIAPLMGFKIPTMIRRFRDQRSDQFDFGSVEDSQEILDESMLLEKIPRVRQLTEHIDSVLSGRQKELSEVEYIFLAKILDRIMLFTFSTVLYIALGCVLAVGRTQCVPGAEHNQLAYRNSIVYKDHQKRLDDETMIIFDKNRDGSIEKAEILNISNTHWSHQKQIKYINSMFYKRDVNNDSKITVRELNIYSQRFSDKAKKCDAHIIKMLSEADQNFDQKLEFYEFINICESLPNHNDVEFKSKLCRKDPVLSLKNYWLGSAEERNDLCWETFQISDFNEDNSIHAYEIWMAFETVLPLFEQFSIRMFEREKASKNDSRL